MNKCAHTHTDTLSHSPEGAGKGRQAGGKVKERGIVRRGGQRKTGKEGLKGGGGGSSRNSWKTNDETGHLKPGTKFGRMGETGRRKRKTANIKRITV